MARGRRRRGGHGGGEASDERWLLTYADMITLLMALFMVLFSISSVNISKYQVLQKSLRAAFSGNILPGGKSIAQQGATNNASHAPSTQDAAAVVPMTALGSRLEASSGSAQASSAHSTSALATGALTSVTAAPSASQASAAQQEANVFAHIKQQIDAYAKAHGVSGSVRTSIEARGLVIRVLTDQLLFDSGQASLQPPAMPLLKEIANLINVDQVHPVDVEGNTDNVPISTAAYPSNWELSSARAGAVLRFLAAHGVGERRLTAVGSADQRPIASNLDAAGRRRNRRVDIVLRRIYGPEGEKP